MSLDIIDYNKKTPKSFPRPFSVDPFPFDTYMRFFKIVIKFFKIDKFYKLNFSSHKVLIKQDSRLSVTEGNH